MNETNAIAVVGVGAILPDAPDVQSFWKNIQAGRYSISEVPADRWRMDLFFDPDPAAPDKTYSKLGGWVRGFKFDARQMGIAIPPRVMAQIDEGQQWAIAASFQALQDYGYPSRSLDPERVAVILGSALGGEQHYRTTIRIHLPEYIDLLSSLPSFKNLPGDVQASLINGFTSGLQSKTEAITEDTMPGELSNIIAGRVANVFNFSGPNFVTDAACASSLAALQSAMEGLASYKYDAVLTGGVDRNMGPEAFVKFSKIGALSPDGSRPYDEGANGFIMGEGAAIFILKRLVDAERDGDRIYAVIRAVGGSSDGKGKGITAPNPLGQKRAIERAWKSAGISPEGVGLIEGHGTSTPVGDLAEVNSLSNVFGNLGLKTGSVMLGSVKSNFGHLKSAAGAAGLLKAVLALNDRLLPPSVNYQKPNPNIDFAHLPFQVNTETRPWEVRQGEVRRAGVSSFGFGGTNFHVALEEYLPGMLGKERSLYPGADLKSSQGTAPQPIEAATMAALQPYRGMLFVSADTVDELRKSLNEKIETVKLGNRLQNRCPSPEEAAKAERLVIDYDEPKDLLARATKAAAALESDSSEAWQALGVQGIYRGRGRQTGKLAFLFPGQGSQYVNMLRDLRELEPIVADTFREADEVMTPILGKPITSYIFVDGGEDAIAQAETKLRHTDITQPAILAVNVALMRVMAKFGFKPDLVIGHSLGEYGALVAAGVMTFSEALRTVSARGQEMVRVATDDNGCMAAVSAPLEQVEQILKTTEGYVVIANYNSPVQCVIGGSTVSVDAAIAAFQAAGLQAAKIPVSHAFHTRIVAAVGAPLRKVIDRMDIQSPRIPIIANVTGAIYPTKREEILDILAAQVGSPVRFVQGVNTLYEQGVRIFVEVGPKRVLSGLASDILREKKDVTVLATNHPRKGDLASLNEAMCRLYAAGVTNTTTAGADGVRPGDTALAKAPQTSVVDSSKPSHGSFKVSAASPGDGRPPITGSVVISGAGLGLPGRNRHVFDDNNILSLLNGEMRIEPLPEETRAAMLEKHPVRLVKSESGAVMQVIEDLDQTIKLAGQRGQFDPVAEFGFPPDRLDTIDISTQLAIAAGIEALRDAGIPLVMTYKQTSTGSFLPNGWRLPEALADETGVIFGSAFPGLDRMAGEADQYYQSQVVLKQLEELRRMADMVPARQTDLKAAFSKRIAELEAEASRTEYRVDRRYVFRVLSMGHSQFAEYIGARGPNTHVNAACATTTNAIAIAEDWIRAGRARRVIVIAGDDVISGNLPDWIATSLMTSGAATVEGDLRLASLPFDRRRNGMIIGMGAAALVIESEDAVRERGMRAICELMVSHIANSAYHGTRLNVDHVSHVMETLLATAERRFGISRHQIAKETVFVSHETYTPARGGSAAAEIHALRQVFGANANQVVIANTKGFTGHTMGVGVEDVIAVKALEHGLVPPIANIQEGFEPDPELGDLNLSHGGKYPVQYSLRLGAGFGSQIAMTLMRKIPGLGERVDRPAYHRWLSEVSGHPDVELEISQRTLRIKDPGTPAQVSPQSRWEYGQAPALWAASEQPEAALESLPQPPAVSIDTVEIKKHLLASVSEKTGYPVEMLDLDLDLEADLGVDTVKQAELFASIREHYGIPRRSDLRLADYNTLAKVIAFVESSLGAEHARAIPATVEQTLPPAEPGKTELPGGTGSASHDEIKSYLLASVSEKTGYPVEMLDLDLDLEADLGIDTVKQAELFASIREHYGIPRRSDLRLADYNTLAKVIAFVEDALRSHQETASTVPEIQASPEPNSNQSQVTMVRRVPVPALRPRLDLCIPTNVELKQGMRVIIVDSKAKTAEPLIRKLRNLNLEVLCLHAGSGSEAISTQVKAWLAEGPIHGVYFLPGLETEAPLADMHLTDWQESLEQRLFSLYTLMRSLSEDTFLVCATRLGGLHGYSAAGATAPMGGAISGFAKSLARERTNAFVKVVDFESSASPAFIASCLIEETLHDPGVVEVGREHNLRFGIASIEEALPAEGNFSLETGSVFLVSGGSSGIVQPIIEDLARVTRGTFYLMGRAPLPDPDDKDVTRFTKDRNGLKNELIARLSSGGKRATPVQVEQALLGIERSAKIVETLKNVQQLGGKANYISCNITDPAAVEAVIQGIKAAEGRVDVFLHAAGVEHSRKLESKPIEEFRQVVAVKADGFFNIFKSLEKHDILPRAVVFFSSVAGRFGNSGQTDYGAANDLLCKMASAFRREYPAIKTIALDWSAWGEVGMATRGNIPMLMKMAGIDLLPPEQAAPLVRAELLAGNGEVIAAGSLGLLLEPHSPHGGMDLDLADQALRAGKPIHTMLSHITDFDLDRGLVLEAELDPKAQPFLYDHARNGTPILPGVMGIEGFAVAARHIGTVLASDKGEMEVGRLENIRFLSAFKFYRNEPRRVTWIARTAREANGLVVYVTLESTRVLKTGDAEHIRHFSGKVCLNPQSSLPEEVVAHSPKWNGRSTVRAEDIYKVYFHGPAFQVLEGVQRSGNVVIGKMNKNLPAITGEGHPLASAPTLLELCFQTAGIWEIGATGTMALPRSIESLTIHRQSLNGVAIYAEVNPFQDKDGSLCFDARVVDAKGRLYLDLKEYRTTPVSYSVQEELLEPLKELIKES